MISLERPDIQPVVECKPHCDAAFIARGFPSLYILSMAVHATIYSDATDLLTSWALRRESRSRLCASAHTVMLAFEAREFRHETRSADLATPHAACSGTVVAESASKRLWRRYVFNTPCFVAFFVLQLLGVRTLFRGSHSTIASAGAAGVNPRCEKGHDRTRN